LIRKPILIDEMANVDETNTSVEVWQNGGRQHCKLTECDGANKTSNVTSITAVLKALYVGSVSVHAVLVPEVPGLLC